VWAPPVIGWISASYGLRAAMAFIVASTAGIVVAGLLVPVRGAGGDPEAELEPEVSPPG
jgi:hypothetical protein